MKRAFTLIELLIVIGIIAVLAGVLLGNYSGIIERARSAKCQTNLKNLANAVHTYAADGRYPFAESAQALSEAGPSIYEAKGWISWMSRDKDFPIQGDSPISLQHVSYANNSREDVFFAITNGAIWTAMGRNHDSYICPVHADACAKQGVRQPGWSYQMNAWFGYEETKGQADALWDPRYETGHIARADRRLLFAEIPGLDPDGKIAHKCGAKLPRPNLTGGDDDDEMCGCLKYKTLSGGKGTIGFNHMRGREIVGHVAFADGHVESFAAPKSGDSTELTDWLCRACDVSVDGKDYRKVFDPDEEARRR